MVRLARAPGAREARVAHLLAGPVDPAGPAPEPTQARTSRVEQLEGEVAALRQELADLRADFEAFRSQF